MFGLFKKKKAADLEASIEMAYKDILTKLIDKKEIAKIATAHAPEPQAKVSPAPRSQTLTSIKLLDIICENSTLVF